MAILKAIQDFGNWFWGIPILILIGGGGLFDHLSGVPQDPATLATP